MALEGTTPESTPAPAGTPAPSGTPAATPAPSGTPAGTPAASAATPASPSATPQQFAYPEDRSDWIPRHRLNEVTGKLTSLEKQIKERDDRMAMALGLKPSDPNAGKIAAIREGFVEVFPHLKPLLDLTPEQIQALTNTPQAAAQFQSAEERRWMQHKQRSMSAVHSDIASAMGVETLDDEQKINVEDSFGRWLRTKAQAELKTSNGQESKTLERYENGDEGLLKEFSTAFTKRWADPGRRTATAQTINRIKPTPSSAGRSQVSSVQRPEKFKSLDERLDYALQLGKERGLQFGR